MVAARLAGALRAARPSPPQCGCPFCLVDDPCGLPFFLPISVFFCCFHPSTKEQADTFIDPSPL